MTALLLTLLFFAQGNPLAPPQTGKISGVLKDAEGKPIPGIRMAAMPRPESFLDAVTSASMSSIAETDEAGRYTLENIPPGKYFIAAGRLDLQTYYPGTQDMNLAKEVAVTPGATVTGIDFGLDNSSFGRANMSLSTVTYVTIPLRVTVEGGGPIPVSSNGRFTHVKMEMISNTQTAPLSGTFISVQGPTTTSHVVTVESLPEHYSVKSIMYGSTDLSKNPLRLTPANFPPVLGGIAIQLGPVLQQAVLNSNSRVATTTGATPTTAAQTSAYQFGTVTTDPAALQIYLAGAAAGAAAAGVNLPNALPRPPAHQIPPETLFITLTRNAPKTGGVRVAGKTTYTGARSVFLSGIPGNYYSDGTFEVLNVPPGKHVLATRDTPSGSRPLAASLVVGATDLDGVVLNEAAIIPASVWEQSEPRPAGDTPPGILPLARLTGTVREEISGLPIPEGTVMLKVERGSPLSLPIDDKGKFEIPPLLPGSNELDVQIFGHSNTRQTIAVEDKDMKLEIASRKLY
jgi:hypothetical protein